MKVLLISPQPFFQERGTPIAVKLVAETLTEAGYSVDLLTYPEGDDIHLPNFKIRRVAGLPFIKNIPIGFSWKKLIYDGLLSIYLPLLLFKNKYDVVHAVEESVFPSIILNFFRRRKLIYDMDSSMADQIVEKWAQLSGIKNYLDKFENFAFQHADVVLPVCKELADKVLATYPEKSLCILEDVAFESSANGKTADDIRTACQLKGLLALYVGNLEHYQGIDLMLEGFAGIPDTPEIDLVIIGGNDTDIQKYRLKAKELGINERVHFLGPRPVQDLPEYLAQADILISPRIKGKNTPMKIYSYLISGKPVLATKISSHTQVLDSTCSVLVEPMPEDFARGLARMASDPQLRRKIGEQGQKLARERFSLSAYKKKLLNVYSSLENSPV